MCYSTSLVTLRNDIERRSMVHDPIIVRRCNDAGTALAGADPAVSMRRLSCAHLDRGIVYRSLLLTLEIARIY